MTASPVKREKRRRRVLRDESAAVRKAARPQTTGSRRYTDAALAESQPRITDLLPRQQWKLGLVFGVGLLLIMLLEAVFSWQAHRMVPGAPPIAPVCDLATNGSLGSWAASLVLLGCCVTALVIFNVRRHRIADYRGRYRWWLWTAVVFFIASADATAGLDRVLTGGLVKLTGGALGASHVTWLVLGWTLVTLSVGVPLLLELRQSHTATWLLLAAGLAYAAAGLLLVGVFRGSSPIAHVVLQTSLLYSAHLLTLTSLLTFGRLAHLDAQGELERKARRPVKKIAPPQWLATWQATRAQRRAAKKSSRTARQPKPRTKPRRDAPRKSPQVVQEEYDPDEERQLDPAVLQNPQLTKTERRKLRKQLKQQRRAA